jgi:hypothetical protein
MKPTGQAAAATWLMVQEICQWAEGAVDFSVFVGSVRHLR